MIYNITTETSGSQTASAVVFSRNRRNVIFLGNNEKNCSGGHIKTFVHIHKMRQPFVFICSKIETQFRKLITPFFLFLLFLVIILFCLRKSILFDVAEQWQSLQKRICLFELQTDWLTVSSADLTNFNLETCHAHVNEAESNKEMALVLKAPVCPMAQPTI